MFSSENPRFSVINVLLIVERKQNTDVFETIKEIMHDVFFKNKQMFPKFHCTLRSFMGYRYMINHELSIDHCVKTINMQNSTDDEVSKEEFMNLIEECYSAPLPKNGDALWDVFVGTKPITWKERVPEKSNHFPVLFRVNHGIGDGVSLLKLFAGIFADLDVELVSSEPIDNEFDELKNCKNLFGRIFQICLKYFNIILLAPSTFFIMQMIFGNDSNLLCKSQRSRRETLACKSDEFGTYFQKIKAIKSKLEEFTFSEILFTAFSASLADYFLKNSGSCPNYISMPLPASPKAMEIQNMLPGSLRSTRIDMSNDFIILALKLPLYIQNKDNLKFPLMNRLKLIKKEIENINKPVDYLVSYYIFTTFLGIFPVSIMNALFAMKNLTGIFSLLAGPRKLTLGNGTLGVEDVLFWVPHTQGACVNFGFLTYDNRLQIAVNADKAVVSDRDSLQSIIDEVFNYLDALEEEINSLS